MQIKKISLPLMAIAILSLGGCWQKKSKKKARKREEKIAFQKTASIRPLDTRPKPQALSTIPFAETKIQKKAPLELPSRKPEDEYVPLTGAKEEEYTPPASYKSIYELSHPYAETEEPDEVEDFIIDDDRDIFMPLDLSDSGTQTLEVPEQSDEPIYLEEPENQEFRVIHFDFDKHDIRPDQQPLVDSNVELAKACPKGSTIVFEGHCDAFGSSAYNMALSEKRAQSVAKQFMKAGIPKSQIKIAGRGKEMLIVSSGSKDEQAPNRRTEIYTVVTSSF